MRVLLLVSVLVLLATCVHGFAHMAHRGGEGALQPPTMPPLKASSGDLNSIATKKATCPFVGSAVAGGALKVYQSTTSPLASIQEVVALGNTGGGTLGYVLQLFATGNHAIAVPGKNQVPLGMFSLDFPGSQGSHPGHSGTLQSDWRLVNSGRWSQPDFDRLLKYAQNGLIKRSDFGKFIGDNLKKDKNSKVVGSNVLSLLAQDVGASLTKIAPAITSLITKGEKASASEIRDVAISVTKVLGEENLIGSAGEFGLLFAFLKQSKLTKVVDGEDALSVADLTSMFRDKKLPDGWQLWKKSGLDWVTSTTALAVSAAKHYASLP